MKLNQRLQKYAGWREENMFLHILSISFMLNLPGIKTLLQINFFLLCINVWCVINEQWSVKTTLWSLTISELETAISLWNAALKHVHTATPAGCHIYLKIKIQNSSLRSIDGNKIKTAAQYGSCDQLSCRAVSSNLVIQHQSTGRGHYGVNSVTRCDNALIIQTC